MDLTPDEQRRLWKSRNKGCLKAIAERLGLSQAFVSDVFNRKKGNVLVEHELRRMGAPGFEDGK